MKFWMIPIGAVIVQRIEEFVNGAMNSLSSAERLLEMTQALNRTLKGRSGRRFERLADQLVNGFPDRAAAQGAPLSSSLGLEFEDQMEMAKLKQPIVTSRQRLHPGEIVDDHGLDTGSYFGWKSSRDLFPFGHPFPARKQHRIQKKSSFSRTRLERREVKNPGFVSKIKPQAIGDQDQGPVRNPVWIGTSHELAQGLAKAITERGQCQRRTLRQMPERASLQKDLAQELGGCANRSAASLFAANAPGSFASGTLPTPVSEAINRGSTTERFRMLSFHTCELSCVQNVC